MQTRIIISLALLATLFNVSIANKNQVYAQPVTPLPDSPSSSNPDKITNASLEPGEIEILQDGAVRLSTKDGLSLTLDSAGQVTALLINGEQTPVSAALPLVIRDLSSANSPNTPNGLVNPSFEENDLGWSPLIHNDVDIEIATDAAKTGNTSLTIRSHDQDGIGAVISDPIPVVSEKRYRVSGHFKLEFGYVDEGNNPTFWQDSLYNASPTISGLYIQWLNTSGVPLDENPIVAVPLHWNAQDWHKITREIVAPPEAASVQIIAGVRPVRGSAWIDDLAWIESPEFDQPLEGSLIIEDDRVIQAGEIAGLQVEVTYTPYSDHIAVNTKITDTSGVPRAIAAAWGLPLNLTAWIWWDGLRETWTITPAEDYARSVSADIAGYLPISLYPFSLIENGVQGLSMGLSLESPRYVLMQYDGISERFEARAHLGISPQADKLASSADFTLLLFQVDPTWGLRATAAKHAQINPDWYDTLADFSGFSDFDRSHFSARGLGGARLLEYNESSVYAAQYMVYELSVYMQDGDEPRPSYTEAWDSLEALSDSEISKASYPSSVICDSAGERHLKLISVTPWSGNRWNPIWIPNMDPDLPAGFGRYKLFELEKLLHETHQTGLTLDGIFIDNFISTSTMDLCPDHLAAADLPLTYDPNTYQPAIHTASAGWEFLLELRNLLDKQVEP